MDPEYGAIEAAVIDAVDSIERIGIPTHAIAMDTEIDEFDSLQVLELQVELEEKFDRKISTRRLLRMKTLGDIVAFLIQKKVALRNTDQPA